MFYFFYNLSNIDFFAKFALLLSNEITYLAMFLILVWAFFQKSKRMYSFSILVLSLFFAWLLANIIKYITHIERPFMKLDIVPLVFEKGYSFPSEHTSIFFALAFSTFFLNKKIGVLMYVLAVLIGLSRVVKGVHYPMDILGGIVLGTLVGFIFVKIFKKI